MHAPKLRFEWPGNFRHPALQGLYLKKDKSCALSKLGLILVVSHGLGNRQRDITHRKRGGDDTLQSYFSQV